MRYLPLALLLAGCSATNEYGRVTIGQDAASRVYSVEKMGEYGPTKVYAAEVGVNESRSFSKFADAVVIAIGMISAERTARNESDNDREIAKANEKWSTKRRAIDGKVELGRQRADVAKEAIRNPPPLP